MNSHQTIIINTSSVYKSRTKYVTDQEGDNKE